MAEQNEIVVGSHNDLDALGTMLNIEYRFPTIQKKYFHTNYSDIPKFVDNIINYAKEKGIKHILLTDVSFSDNKESLMRIHDLTAEGFKVTLIDHHMYPEGFFADFPNMKIIHDKTKSATLLCNEYFGNAGKNENLDKLTFLIDVYDLWQKDNPAFDMAQDLNEFFWTYDIGLLNKEIVENGFKLPKSYKEVVTGLKQKCANDIADYERRNLINRAGQITLCFVDAWFNQIMLKEMANGKNFVIGINSYGIIRVRIRQEAPYDMTQINKLREILTGNAEYGHGHAFTYRIEGAASLQKLMAEAQRVVTAIQESCHG